MDGDNKQTDSNIAAILDIVAAAKVTRYAETMESSTIPQPIDIKEGKEALVPLNYQIPRSANFKKLRVKLGVNQNKMVEVNQKSTVKEISGTSSETSKSFDVTLSLNNPLNLTVRLDGGQTFWTVHTRGTGGSFVSPDFSAEANAYLDRLPPVISDNSEVVFNFLIKSNGSGTVDLSNHEMEMDYSIIQTNPWRNPLDDTTRLDRNFQLDFGSIERVSLSGNPPSGFSLAAIRSEAGGSFGPERLLGQVEIPTGGEFATISNEYALAQAIVIPHDLIAKPINCVGVTAFWQAEAEAELYFEIQTDVGGAPAAGKPLVQATLALPATAAGQWHSVNFEQPTQLSPDRLYWLVAKGIRGRARLGFSNYQGQTVDYLGQTVVNRGGQLWKSLGPPISNSKTALRLIYLPELDNQTTAVEFSVNDLGIKQSLDPDATMQTLSLDLSTNYINNPVTLLIKSHARGSLRLANLIQEYIPKSK